LIINIDDEQERAFITIANETYKKYESEKKRLGKIDFNEILKTSAKKLDSSECDIDMKL
jgi:ATP-dependent exoDNAse (exonuclease V) beta subunit